MDGVPLNVRFHRLVNQDVQEAMIYYEGAAGAHIADDFYQQVMTTVQAVSLHPHRFHFALKGLRRANLKRFPYHLLFQESPRKIRIIVVRHHKRHPKFGLSRLNS